MRGDVIDVVVRECAWKCVGLNLYVFVSNIGSFGRVFEDVRISCN